MLVLTRRLLEKVYIGDHICVTVVRLEGGQVRLGIDAPRDVPVVREELLGRWERAHPPAGPSAAIVEGGPAPASAPEGSAGAGRPVRIPPSSARGTDSRRPGPSR